jgi:cytochrome c-type biogenesis protein
MFVALGAGAAWFGNTLLANRRPLEIAGGAFIIVAAVVFAGVPLPRILAAERRFHVAPGRRSFATAGITGVAFAVGWTPCIGPTLAAILTLSAGQASAARGAILLAVYSLGLGVPFLLFGLLFTRALGLVRALRRHWRVVSLGSSALLVTFGALLITGDLVSLTTRLSRFAGWQI